MSSNHNVTDMIRKIMVYGIVFGKPSGRARNVPKGGGS